MRTFSREEIKKHCSEQDVWIIIDTQVYNMSSFIDLHPGRAFPLLEVAGQDATDEFYGLHRKEVLTKYTRYKIGVVENEQPQSSNDLYSKVPYAEPNSWMGFKSPYFSESHYRFRDAIRRLSEELAPMAREIHDAGTRPTNEFMKKLGDYHLLACNIGPGPWLHGVTLLGGLAGKDYDYFHELILHEEFARWGVRGFEDGTVGSMIISAPTVLNFGSSAIQQKYMPAIFSGEKRIALAITEPYAGSDVAGFRTTAKLTEDGKHFIVNGVKKWITGGCWADLFSVAVKTEKGMSMLLVERSEGVDTRLIKTSYSTSAGTAYVVFDQVKVPVENLLGVEGKGLQVVLSNFNHERWMIMAGASMTCRVAIEECFQWAVQRHVFGKRLIDQPVIRYKLAKMISSLESVHAWLENITYQMCNMNYAEQSDILAGPIALCKYKMTRVLHDVSDEACQIFGGRALTKSGMGRTIEQLQRVYKFSAILGGSEEIMADLGVKQALKKFPKAARL